MDFQLIFLSMRDLYFLLFSRPLCSRPQRTQRKKKGFLRGYLKGFFSAIPAGPARKKSRTQEYTLKEAIEKGGKNLGQTAYLD
jgi:hypothetical protein